MKTWFCAYTRDGIVTFHLIFDAYSAEEAVAYLKKEFNINNEEILDLHETVY